MKHKKIKNNKVEMKKKKMMKINMKCNHKKKGATHNKKSHKKHNILYKKIWLEINKIKIKCLLHLYLMNFYRHLF